MIINYSDYINLGYSMIPEKEFARYSVMAERTARRFADFETDACGVSDDNRRGICEIADILYAEKNQLNRPLAGFANEKYRESYAAGRRFDPGEKIWEIMAAYFSRGQLYRGV